jgi:hypothetical protein
MTVNSLFPAFVELSYHSEFAPHVMTIPTLAWNDGPDAGVFDTWDTFGVDADDMVQGYVTLAAPFFPATVSFDSYTIFTMDDPTAQAIPRASKAVVVAGSNATPGWYKAVQATFTFKTDLGGVFKNVLLDVGVGNDFDPKRSIDVSGPTLAFIDYLMAVENGWAGRDGGQPSFFLQVSNDLNDKLREQYHMN